MERVKGIEPSFSAWEADDVPIYFKADVHDQKPNDYCGSLADLFTNSSLMAGIGWKADVRMG